jgi:hypothetical protein
MSNPRKLGALALASGLTLVLAGSSALAASAGSNAVCYRAALKPRPAWVSGAAWVEERGELVVLDPFLNRLFAYTPSGAAGKLPETFAKAASKLQPASISAAGEAGFLVETVDGKLMPFDAKLRPKDGQTVLKEKGASGYRVGSLIQWKVIGGDIIAYGSLLKEGAQGAQGAELGFFRLPLAQSASARLQMLKPLEDISFYLVGNSYITATRDAAYFVAMDKAPAIFRISARGNEVERLNAFPDEYRTRPDFHTVMRGPDSAPAHFAELETFAVASGLYAQDGMLYLLTRKPDDKGGTTWSLYKIDPEKDRLLGKVNLPTSANLLTVVPSQKAWYLLERGRLQAGQRQDIDNLLVIDSAAIAALSLPSACPTK